MLGLWAQYRVSDVSDGQKEADEQNVTDPFGFRGGARVWSQRLDRATIDGVQQTSRLEGVIACWCDWTNAWARSWGALQDRAKIIIEYLVLCKYLQ